MGTEAMRMGRQGSELLAEQNQATPASVVAGAARVTGQRGRAGAKGLPGSASRLSPQPEAPASSLPSA